MGYAMQRRITVSRTKRSGNGKRKRRSKARKKV